MIKEIINCTPHDLEINGKTITPCYDFFIRINSEVIFMNDFMGIGVFKVRKSENSMELPQKEGTAYLVSNAVCQHNPHRKDFYVPKGMGRGDKKNNGILRNPSYQHYKKYIKLEKTLKDQAIDNLNKINQTYKGRLTLSTEQDKDSVFDNKINEISSRGFSDVDKKKPAKKPAKKIQKHRGYREMMKIRTSYTEHVRTLKDKATSRSSFYARIVSLGWTLEEAMKTPKR